MVEIAKFFVMKYPLPEEVTMPTYEEGLLVQERTVSCAVRRISCLAKQDLCQKAGLMKSLMLFDT